MTPLYAVLNVEWAPKSLYPQPRAQLQQKTTYLDLMKALLDKGADPNARLTRRSGTRGTTSTCSGVDETGATPFWRAAYASDVEAMKLLVALRRRPDDPDDASRPAGRAPATSTATTTADVSGLPPVPVGGPGVTPLLAAAGVGYGEGFAANSHRFAPAGMLAAVKYLVEELARRRQRARPRGQHRAAPRRGARRQRDDPVPRRRRAPTCKRVNRAGQTTVDMANGPVQRVQPFPETITLLERPRREEQPQVRVVLAAAHLR